MSPRDSILRLHAAANTGDRAVVAEATGAELMKDLFARFLRAYPDLHIQLRQLGALDAQ